MHGKQSILRTKRFKLDIWGPLFNDTKTQFKHDKLNRDQFSFLFSQFPRTHKLKWRNQTFTKRTQNSCTKKSRRLTKYRSRNWLEPSCTSPKAACTLWETCKTSGFALSILALLLLLLLLCLVVIVSQPHFPKTPFLCVCVCIWS